MRKHLLGLAALSLLVGASSCQKESAESASDGKKDLTFKPALGKQTQSRASEFIYWSNGAMLDVHSYKLSSDVLFQDFQLTYNATAILASDAWTYNPAVEQPGEVLRFYSVYPISAAITFPTPTATSYTFGYTIQDPQQDLVGASVSTPNNIVTLNFKHLLSQVNFAVMGIEGVEITIGDINLASLKNAGTYTFGATTPWSGLSGTAPYTYLSDVDAVAALKGTGTGGATNDMVALGNGTTIGNALMLMPQAFGAPDDGTFTFTYSLKNDTDGDDDIDGDDDYLKENIPVTVNFSDFDTKAWVPGKRYTYVIDFAPLFAGQDIEFRVKMTEWEDDDDFTTVETIRVADISKASLEAAIASHSTANLTNPDQTVFPISISETVTAGFTVNKIYGFNAEDQIRIEFKDQASVTAMGNDFLKVNGWSITSTDGLVVTLTCETPVVAATAVSVDASAAGDNAGVITAIQDAINDEAINSTAGLTDYSFVVNKDLDASTALATIAGTFKDGDRIRIKFPAASATYLTVSATGWTMMDTVGNEIVLTYTE